MLEGETETVIVLGFFLLFFSDEHATTAKPHAKTAVKTKIIFNLR
jgi:uncharacterized membrane protein